ncbi:MAG: nucleotidyltransferase family protein [Alphaproteobacteria bacterium]
MKKNTNIENALKIISAKICGNNLAYKVDAKNNIAQIIALKDGIFIASDNRLKNFNERSHLVVLNCLFSYSIVLKNQIVAKIEVNDKITMEDVDSIIFNISGNTDLLNIIPKEKKSIALINLKLNNTVEENNLIEKTNQKIKNNLSFLKTEIKIEETCDFSEEELDKAIYSAEKTNPDIIFISSPISDKTIIKKTIEKAFDDIICSHFPEIGVSDILIATKKNIKIIALPYNYATNSSYNLDIIINKAILTEKLIATDFLNDAPVILNSTDIITETSDLITPLKNKENKGNIGGIILAAGTSIRAGTNKLFAEIKGEPVLLKSVKTAIEAGISPIFVILGHREEESKEILKDLDVNIMINSEYRSGIKSSIELGIKSLPNFCQGAFIIPADQPYLTKEHFSKMIKAFDLKKEKQLIISGHNGIKYNPVLWSKSLFEYADIVPENSQTRAFFLSHSDYTTIINAEEEKTLKDITHPADIKDLEKENLL